MFASETPTMFTMDNNTAIAALAPTATYEPTPSVEQVVPVATTTPRHWTFPIAAQPILRMEADGRLAPRVMGYEYLLRPTGGDPMEVAKRLDRIGLGVSLTRAMIRVAIESASSHDGFVAVNLTPDALAQPGITNTIRRWLETSGLDPQRLVLELSEWAMPRDLDRTLIVMRALREMGVRLAVDDLGGGVSPLRYLMQPVDMVKLAKSVLDRAVKSDDTQQLLALVDYVSALGAELVWEGVETPTHLNWIASLNRKALMQGYVFGQPDPAGQVALPRNVA